MAVRPFLCFVISSATPILLSTHVTALPIYVPQDASYQYVNASPDTTQAVPSDWFTFDFDDSGWFSGTAPFSSRGASTFGGDRPNVNGPYAPGTAPPLGSTFTSWSIYFDPYLRTEFTLLEPTPLTIWIAIDNGIGPYPAVPGSTGIFLNGVEGTASINAEGQAFRWEHVFDIPAAYTFAGRNVIALQLEDHGGATAFAMVVSADDPAENPIFSDNPPPTPREGPNQPIPEPGTLGVVALSLAGWAVTSRRKRKANRSASVRF